MTVEPVERQAILNQIGILAEQDLAELWTQASALPSSEFRAYMIEAFPQIVDPFAALAADTATVWYEDSPSSTSYVPTPAPLPAEEKMAASAAWALGGEGAVALERMRGTMQRVIFDAARSTITLNVAAERGASWARHASANACAFCALMATRGAAYNSQAAASGVVGRGKEMNAEEAAIRAAGGNRYQGRMAAGGVKERGVRKLGSKYHDHCHCIAVEVRPGQSYEPPPYVQQWDDAYRQAARETPKTESGAIDPTAVLAHMRTSLGTH